jgi:hypothetical protein
MIANGIIKKEKRGDNGVTVNDAHTRMNLDENSPNSRHFFPKDIGNM